MRRLTLTKRIGTHVILAAAAVLVAAPALADSCREWKREHTLYKAEVVRGYLQGAPDAALDGALFELLQREAYLATCEIPLRTARTQLVGWRLVGRSHDEYARAVVESTLEHAGLDLDFGGRFANAIGHASSFAAHGYGGRR